MLVAHAQLETSFENDHLQCKLNHKFRKSHPAYYNQNSLNRFLLSLVKKLFISNDEELIKVV